MSVISVQNLKKHYQVAQKDPGLSGSIRSFFHRRYTAVKAVDGVSFNIEAGELVGFIGPNGAGKTTTLKMLSGLLSPTSGKVSVLGYVPGKRQPDFQKQFSLILGQKNQLWWDLPAQESFQLNKEIYGVPDTIYKKTLNELVELLESRGFFEDTGPETFLGQRMKMELIASLIHTPKILFLDEPTIGLDVVMQKKIRDFIKHYNQTHNSTILLTSHYMDDVKELCKRVIIIDLGKIIFDGSLEDIIKTFGSHKILSVVFSKNIDPEKLSKIGDIKSYDFPKAVISVSRARVSASAANLMQNFPVADLNIEELPIEDVIREVFNSSPLFDKERGRG